MTQQSKEDVMNPSYTQLLSRFAVGALLSLSLAVTGSAAADAGDKDCNNGYPTTAIADYVLGCMAANGNKFETLQQCSCSIDFIKAKLDYETYERAQTILRAQLDIGQRGLFYRESSWAKDYAEQLQKVQAESTLRCF